MHHKTRRAAGRRAFLRLAAAGVGGALLAACGGPQAPGVTDEPPAGDPSSDAARATPTGAAAPAATADTGKVTLVLGHWDRSLRPVLAGFEREHPGVEVRFIPEPPQDHHQGLRSAIRQGKGAPDVAAVELGWLGIFADIGGLVDLASPPFDGARLAGDMVEGAWKAGSVDGKQIAVPWSISPAALWYRADLLADAGIESDPEKLRARAGSWEDLLDLGRELKKNKPDRSLFFDARDIFGVAVAQAEYGWLDGRKVLIEEKGTRPAQLASLARREKLDAALVSGNPQLALKNNELAGIFADLSLLPFLASDYADLSGAWRVLPPPGAPAVYSATFLAVTEQSEQQELAWELVSYLAATAPAQNAYLKAGGAIPAFIPAWADSLYDAGVEYFGGQPAYRLWTEIGRGMPQARLSPYQRDAADAVDTQLGLVVERDKDPKQAMLDAEQALLNAVEGLSG